MANQAVQIIIHGVRTVNQTVRTIYEPFDNCSSSVCFCRSNGFPLMSILPFTVRRIAGAGQWMKEGTTNACWISSPNPLIIKPLRPFTCVRICFRMENSPRTFLATPITLWYSRIQEINWDCITFCYNCFSMQWLEVIDKFRKVMERPFGYMLLDLHPISKDDQRVLCHLLKEEGFM